MGFLFSLVLVLSLCLPIQSSLWSSPHAGKKPVEYDLEKCLEIDVAKVAECMNKNPDIYSEPAGNGEGCYLNVSYINYHPQTELERQEDDFFFVNPCWSCSRMFNDEEVLLTTSVARFLRSRIRTGGHLPAKYLHLTATLSKLDVLQQRFPENFEEFIRKAVPWANFTADRKPFKTCALVGNSANLLESLLGSEIDSHDIVMRFNRAPTKGYEQHVGTKTTFRMLNPGRGRGYWHEKRDEVLLLREIYEKDFQYLHRLKNPFYFVFDPGRPQENASGLGILGVEILYRVCHELHLYGFGVDPFIHYGHYFPGNIGTLGYPKETREFLLMMDCADIFRLHP